MGEAFEKVRFGLMLAVLASIVLVDFTGHLMSLLVDGILAIALVAVLRFGKGDGGFRF